MIRVGIVGGTGYTGQELLTILAAHPKATLEVITSRSESGRYVYDLFPNLKGHYDKQYSVPDAKQLQECDVVFFATPHGVAQSMMSEIIQGGARVIDLSADFRIKDIGLWEKWYGQRHSCPALVDTAVYGLPEFNREQIRNAKLVACPGCYPTSILLGFMPLLEQGLIDTESLIASAVSGVSGAGKQAKVELLLSELDGSFKAYGVDGHRHLPEIEQALREIQQVKNAAINLTFVPHLLPFARGMHATLYAKLLSQGIDLQGVYERRYADEAFVEVLPAGNYPATRMVKTTNLCRIAVSEPQQRGTAVILSTIDNLTKGASGQGIQNMNIMHDLPETLGLSSLAHLP
ncbi:MAG: N-acetyl-gamma-glutamyl-phosphate reductase [Cellvibrionaceae bacterium]|nr:N-acetyl-gamma-glutamyl-phosphate reductase [Cellvibrionaceae bacterium]